VPCFIEMVASLAKTDTQRIQYETLKQRGSGNCGTATGRPQGRAFEGLAAEVDNRLIDRRKEIA
jgi:hypothetical protein